MGADVQKQRASSFTPEKFLFTGRELLVEIRGSLHTVRGKYGFVLFLFGIVVGIWGISGVAVTHFARTDQLIISLCWSNIGLIIMINLQNHRLMYLLPISRKEFAAMQIRKMAWVSVILLLIATVQFACMDLKAGEFWWIFFSRAIPVSIALSSSQIASVQPVKGNGRTGTKIYGLSILVLVLDVGVAFFNLMSMGAFRSIPGSILPALNYLVCMFATLYFYRKIAHTNLYYDEL